MQSAGTCQTGTCAFDLCGEMGGLSFVSSGALSEAISEIQSNASIVEARTKSEFERNIIERNTTSCSQSVLTRDAQGSCRPQQHDAIATQLQSTLIVELSAPRIWQCCISGTEWVYSIQEAVPS